MKRLAIVCVLVAAATACSDPMTDGDIGFVAPVDAGSPDAAPPATVPQVGLVINEVAAAGDPDDWFELYNGSDHPLALDGYGYSDSADEPMRAVFGAGDVIAPGGYRVVYLTDDVGFGLGSAEEVIVTHPDGLVVDHVSWTDGQSPDGQSFARIPDVTGSFETAQATPGSANTL